MENVIWEGKASWKSGIKMVDIVLILLFFWLLIPLILPFIRIASLMGKSYKVTDQRIIITEGVLSRTENEVELFRVKDLSIKQDMFQKMFNIGDITIRSSEVSHSTLEMKGIENAYELREEIRNAVNKSRKENNVRMNEAY